MSTTRVRSRKVPLEKQGSFRLGHFNNAVLSNEGVPTGVWQPTYHTVRMHNYQNMTPYDTAQVTIDQINPGPPYLSGGPFKSETQTFSAPCGGVYGYGTYLRSDRKERYIGGFHSPGNDEFKSMPGFSGSGNLDPFSNANYPSMAGWGDKAWNKTKPKLEKVSGFVFAAESRDLPRMLKTTGKGFHEIWMRMNGSSVHQTMIGPKGAAEHFLNHQFGWAPFLNDVRRMNYIIEHHQSVSRHLTHKNGQWVRRRVTLLEDESTVLLQTGTGNPLSVASMPQGYMSATPTWQLLETTTTKITAVGKFKYYRPEFDANLGPSHNSVMNQVLRAMTIYGLRISPSNVYKATPWSWAVDWFTSLGDYIDHLTDIYQDSVVGQYVYVMQTRKRVRKYILVLPFNFGKTVTLEFDRVIETKERAQASGPFGFDTTWDGLSPRQIAIAVALGITRSRPTGG